MSESPFAPAYDHQVVPPSTTGWRTDVRSAAATVLAVAAAAARRRRDHLGGTRPAAARDQTADGVSLVDPESKAYVGQDAYFLIISAVVGLVCGIVVWWLVRGRDAASAVALTLGGLAGAYLAWRVGRALGPSDLQAWARTAPPGATRALPVDLRATAVLMAWPLMAVLAHLGLVLATDRPVEAGDRREPAPPQ